MIITYEQKLGGIRVYADGVPRGWLMTSTNGTWVAEIDKVKTPASSDRATIETLIRDMLE